MKYSSLLLSLTTLTLTSLAHAQNGGHVGGGGGFRCAGKVRTLDSMEGERRGFKLHLEGATVRKKLESVIQKLEKLDPVDAKALSPVVYRYADDILNTEAAGKTYGQEIMFSKEPLLITDDSLESFSAEGCEKVQIARQKKPIVKQDRLIEIGLTAWNDMNDDEKAVIILHESVYTVMIARFKETTSPHTRYITQNYTDMGFQNQSQCDYIKTVFHEADKDSESLRYFLYAYDPEHDYSLGRYYRDYFLPSLQSPAIVNASNLQCDSSGGLVAASGQVSIEYSVLIEGQSYKKSTVVPSPRMLFKQGQFIGSEWFTRTTEQHFIDSFSISNRWIAALEFLPQTIDLTSLPQTAKIKINYSRHYNLVGDRAKNPKTYSENGEMLILKLARPAINIIDQF